MTFRILFLSAFMLISMSCSDRNLEHNSLKTRPLEKAITETFPNSVPFHEYVDSLLLFLYTVHNISQDRILLGQSSCMDDVINTKTAFANHEVSLTWGAWRDFPSRVSPDTMPLLITFLIKAQL